MLTTLLDLIEGTDEVTEQEMEELDDFFRRLGEPRSDLVIDDEYIEREIMRSKSGD